MMCSEAIIRSFCKDNNLIYGITDAEKLLFDEEELINVPFVNYNVDERLSPKLFNENINSIIFLGIPYYKNEVNFYDKDYHIIAKVFLEELSKKLKGECYSFVDTGALFERGFGLKCGLGFKGKNTSLINDELGSYFNIGYILTSEKFMYTGKLDKVCMGCNKCIENCPTKSLKDYKCNAESCISYLTQKKAVLTIDEMKKIGKSLYGCEICQQVCPHNRLVSYSKTSEEMKPQDILEMSKKQFLKYKDKPFFWRGLTMLKRNALICVYNSDLELKEKFEILVKYNNSEFKLLKETAKILIKDLENGYKN